MIAASLHDLENLVIKEAQFESSPLTDDISFCFPDLISATVRYLEIQECKMNAEDFGRTLALFPNLVELIVRWNYSLGKAFETMGEMKHLEILKSEWVGFTAPGFVNVLLQSPKLRILEVSGEPLAGLSEALTNVQIDKIPKNLEIRVDKQSMDPKDFASLKKIANTVKLPVIAKSFSI